VIVNLEFVKAIVTTHEIFIRNPFHDEEVTKFCSKIAGTISTQTRLDDEREFPAIVVAQGIHATTFI
jgi:hypothetical protein